MTETRVMKRAAFLRIVLVVTLCVLASALLIQSRRANDLERRLQAMTAYVSRIERERQAEIVRRQADQGLILEAPTAAQQPSRSMDSLCRLTSAWLKDEISAADVAPDGARVAAIVGDEVRVWEAATGRLAQQIRFGEESPVSLRFSWDRCSLPVGVARLIDAVGASGSSVAPLRVIPRKSRERDFRAAVSRSRRTGEPWRTLGSVE
jgi:hypothetical protein